MSASGVAPETRTADGVRLRPRVARNFVVLLVLRVGVPLISTVLVFALARVLGAEGLGRYTVAFTLLYFFNTVAPLGLYTLITRDGARDRRALERVLAHALTLSTAASLLLTLAMAAAGLSFYDDPATRRAILILSLSIVPFALGSQLEGAFAAVERMEFIAVGVLLESVVKVGAGLGLLLAGSGLEGILWAAVVARFLSTAVSMYLLRTSGIEVSFGVDARGLRRLAASTPTFLLTAVFATLYWRIDVFMLSEMRPVSDVGLYGGAWRLLEIAITIPQSLCFALYPPVANAIGAQPGTVRRLGSMAARYLFAVSVPAAVCTMLVGSSVLALLYGDSFRPAAGTLTVLMWTVVPYGWVRYNAYVLIAAERQRVDLALNVLMCLVNVALNLFLIPAYGYFGAAVATLISVCVYWEAQNLYLRRQLPGYAAPLGIEPVPLLATALTAFAVWILRDRSVVAGLVLAGPLYLGVLLAGRFFTAGELRMLGFERPLIAVRWAVRAE